MGKSAVQGDQKFWNKTMGWSGNILKWTIMTLDEYTAKMKNVNSGITREKAAEELENRGCILFENKASDSKKKAPLVGAQFAYLNESIKDALDAGMPVMMVNFKRHIAPYTDGEKFDAAAPKGFVHSGMQIEDADFIESVLVRWWKEDGCQFIGNAERLILLGDCDGQDERVVSCWQKALAVLLDASEKQIQFGHIPSAIIMWERECKSKLYFDESSLDSEGRPMKEIEILEIR